MHLCCAHSLGLARIACLLLGLLASSARLLSQEGTFNNEHPVAPALHEEDKEDIWTMHFRFKNPRILTADVPGQGKKIVWYMWYQVINKTGEPHTFIPDFELVTVDRNTRHSDVIVPSVEEVIKKFEDPTGRLDIKNSVTIMKEPIQPTKPLSVPRAYTGLAIWTDVYDRAPDTNKFSIFVSGLSNGWTEDDKGVIRRKTLQLNFERRSDKFRNASEDIYYLPDRTKWIYRAVSFPKDKGTVDQPSNTKK